MMVRWLRDYQIDGFRCDYASGVPTDFWEAAAAGARSRPPGHCLARESDDPALLQQRLRNRLRLGFLPYDE